MCIWIKPSKETNTYGRDDFSIHGGWVPGSAGCIDLASNMDNFVAHICGRFFYLQKVTDMKMSDKGIKWLKGLEGSVKVNGKHVIYDDATGKPVPAGVPLPVGATIGYGHLVKPGEDFSAGLTEQQATELLEQDLQATYNTINEQISADAILNMTQSQYDALVSLVFNIGAGSAAPQNRNRGLYQSTVRKYLNDNKYKSNIYPNLEDAWRAFRNGGILDGRRDAEWRLYNNADYSGY